MTKSIKLTQGQWRKVSAELHNDYPRSVMAIRDRMRKVLGFTHRTHTDFDVVDYKYNHHVYLDFYSETKRTMFLLKYSDIIKNTDKDEEEVI